jgi:hypothetical protein
MVDTSDQVLGVLSELCGEVIGARLARHDDRHRVLEAGQ